MRGERVGDGDAAISYPIYILDLGGEDDAIVFPEKRLAFELLEFAGLLASTQ